MLKTSSKTDDITKFDTGLRFRTLLITNPAELRCFSKNIHSLPTD